MGLTEYLRGHTVAKYLFIGALAVSVPLAVVGITALAVNLTLSRNNLSDNQAVKVFAEPPFCVGSQSKVEVVYGRNTNETFGVELAINEPNGANVLAVSGQSGREISRVLGMKGAAQPPQSFATQFTPQTTGIHTIDVIVQQAVGTALHAQASVGANYCPDKAASTQN